MSVIPCLTLIFVAAAYLSEPEPPPYNSRPHAPGLRRSRNLDQAEHNASADQP